MFGCTAVMLAWGTAPAAAAPSLEEIERATTLLFSHTHTVQVPTDLGAEARIALGRPDYDATTAALDSINRARLNAESRALGADIAERARLLTEDRTFQERMGECAKSSLWDIGWDYDWYLVNGLDPNVNQELQQTYTRMVNCYGEQLGMGPIQAENLADYFMEGIINRATEALGTEPTATAFAEWAAVTAWYSINGSATG